MKIPPVILDLFLSIPLYHTFFCPSNLGRRQIEFKEKWQNQYPSAVKSWEDNWDILSTFFAYPVEIRKIIYTTNIIEGLNRQFRKVTKTKSVFPNDDSLKKMLYLASQNITKKWTQRYKNWGIVISQLEIMHNHETA